MKNILIPTTLEQDAVGAVETAIRHAKGNKAEIVLLTVYETNVVYSASEFLRTTCRPFTEAQDDVLESCSAMVQKTPNCSLKIRRQNGLTGPLLKNLLEYLGTGLIIIPYSYKTGASKLQNDCISLLSKCRVPILHMGPEAGEPAFTNALYLGKKQVQMDIRELQQLVSGQFDFRIVSQAHFEEQNPDDMTPFITDAIQKNNIDLLIETRRPQKSGKKHTAVNDRLGLPVLSIHEEAIRS